MLSMGIERPVALNGAQPLGGIADRRDGYLDGIEPEIGGPGRRLRRSRREQQSAVLGADLAKLGAQLLDEALGRQIAGEQRTLP